VGVYSNTERIMTFEDMLTGFPDGSKGIAYLAAATEINEDEETVRIRFVRFPFLVFKGELIGLN